MRKPMLHPRVTKPLPLPIFNAGSRNMANIIISNVLSVFRADGQNKLADWLENNIEECLTVIDCPPEVQNALEPLISWKASTDSSNAEQTLFPSSPLKLLCSEL